MTAKSLQVALAEELPILFVYIGWSYYYNGTEDIKGGHSYLKNNPRKNSESSAFRKGPDGFFRCGIGSGSILCERLHTVFVARDPMSRKRKVVGLYAAALTEPDSGWSTVKSLPSRAACIPPARRPVIPSWLEGQGLRRWAWRGGELGSEHPALRKFFDLLRKNISYLTLPAPAKASPDQTYADLEGLEGQQQKRLQTHRRREVKLREAKIQEVLSKTGRLICEVPRCGFDFRKRYGKLGQGYAHVHHLQALGQAKKQGQKTKLGDLAVVCANCHAMIHKGGECRPMASLILR